MNDDAKALGSERLAAVDLGSNSFHMVVATCRGDHVQVVDRLRETVRLAAGLDDNGRLTEAAKARALACLARFGQRLRTFEPGTVRAVGTSSLRRAVDADRFLIEADQALGHPVEVVSGFEEARLVYLGVAYSLGADSRRRLAIDIGGGSTELIVGHEFETERLASLDLGCVRFTEKFFPDGDLRPERWREAELRTARELEPVQQRFQAGAWDHAVGASGTIEAVETVLIKAGWSEAGITRDALQRLRAAMMAAERLDGLTLEGLSRERGEVFAGGVAILWTLFERLGIERLTPTEGALREGLLYDLSGARHERVRSTTVASLQRRFHVDSAQARRVADAAAGLLAQAETQWGPLDAALRRLLCWAAELHEIGLDISHSGYHKHGAYVLSHADLAGFSREEQALLGVLVRGHRRKFPERRLSRLPTRYRKPAVRLTRLLRLAVLLRRGRTDEPLPSMTLEATSRRWQLAFPPGWLDEHPLLRADLEREAELLARVGLELDVR